MKFKKIFLITLLLLAIFTVSAVSASDNLTDTNENVLQENTNEEMELSENASEEQVSSVQEDIIGEADDGTFTALQTKVNKAAEDSTITLENDYVYDEGFNVNGISISRSLTIDGNNHIIDAKLNSRIFKVNPNTNLTLKNLILLNGHNDADGGAIYVYNANLNVINCSFTNNSAETGGAIYTNESNIVINNSKFFKNIASSGGSIIARRSNVDIYGTVFESNYAGGGGSLSLLANGKRNIAVKLKNNLFKNSTATSTAGFFSTNIPTTVENCTFENYDNSEYGGIVADNNFEIYDSKFKNSYAMLGGALRLNGDKNSNIRNCTFENNRGEQGGSIYSEHHLVISDCDFVNNAVGNFGGAIYNKGDYSNIISCTFKICKSTDEGGAIYNEGNNLNILSCDFINCYTNTYLNKTTQDSSICNIGNNLIVKDCTFTDADTPDDGTFTSLQVKINKAAEGSTLTLENDYVYDNGFDIKGIKISKSLTIDGNNHIIDAKLKSRIFNIEPNHNVILKNLILVNGYNDADGGAIYVYNANLTITNSLFTDNTAETGGAIYAYEANLSLSNNEFYKNKVLLSGGSIRAVGTNIGLFNNIFESNYAGGGGSLMLLASGKDVVATLENNTFKNSTANSTAGFFYTNIPTTVRNCTFENYDNSEYGGIVADCNIVIFNSKFKNSYAMLGGAIRLNGDKNSNIINCTFENNRGEQGGAIYSEHHLSISNSNFVNNTVEHSGGAIFSTGDYSSITSCDFKNCKALELGGAIYNEGNNLNILSCDFINCYTNAYSNKTTKESSISNVGNNLILNDCTYTDIHATETVIEALSVTTVYNGNKYLVATLKDINGNGLVGFEVLVDLNGVKKLTTDGNGQVKLSTNGLVPNSYDVTISFEGNENYVKSNTTTKVIVNKDSTKLTANVVTTTFNVIKDLVITLKDSKDNSLSGFEVLVDLNGVKKLTTDGNGQVKLSTYGLVPNSYDVAISFEGNENYTGSNAATMVFVNKDSTKLTANVVTTTFNVIKDLVITLKDSNDNSLSGFEVLVDLNGVKKLTTDGNGQVKLSTYGLVPNSYDVAISFEGNENYTGSNAATMVFVNKDSTKLTADVVTTTYNINKNIIITLENGQGNALSGFEVSVNIDGSKTYATNKNGQIIIATGSLVPKTYSVEITFKGDNNYLKSTTNTKIVVKKATPKITAKKKTFKRKVKTKKYTITLKNNVGKAINKAKVTIKIKKKTYTAKTNAKGKATFKIKKLTKKGNYKATITYKGNAYYNKVTKKVNIKIK